MSKHTEKRQKGLTGRAIEKIPHLSESSADAIMAPTVQARGFEAGSTLDVAVERPEIRLGHSHRGHISSKVSPCEVGTEVASETARISTQVAIRSHAHGHVLEGPVGDTSSSSAAGHSKGILRRDSDKRTVATKTMNRVKHRRVHK
jgi:hypothetical protein